jgi:Immunity protein 53
LSEEGRVAGRPRLARRHRASASQIERRPQRPAGTLACASKEQRTWDDLAVLDEPRDCLYLLQRWYVAQCDSEWEHSYGVSIDTLDNPGWTLRIDLAGTRLAGTTRDWSKVERSEHDWLHWRVHDDRYEAACGPTNLNEAIVTFLDLAGARSPA